MTTKGDKVHRILIIEDDVATRQAAVFKLERENFEVVQAEDGIQALEILAKDKAFDAILLDIRMPRGDGFHFLEGKKKDASLEAIPVIVFTNLSQSDYGVRAIKLGAKGYMVKANHSLNNIVLELKKCIEGKECRIDI